MQNKWGHLSIINRELESILKRGKPTGEYRELWTLKCDCGNTVKVDTREFAGRNVMRACGLPDCTFSYPTGKKRLGRPPSEDPGSACTLWLPYRIQSLITDYMAFRGSKKGASAADLMDRGANATYGFKSKHTKKPRRIISKKGTHAIHPQSRPDDEE